MPHGVVAIRGTIFSLSTDGTVYVLSGSVYITTNKPDGTVVTMLVPAGSSFNPLTALPGAQPTPITVPESSSWSRSLPTWVTLFTRRRLITP